MPGDSTAERRLERQPHRLVKAVFLPRCFAYYHNFGLTIWIALETGEGWSLILPGVLLLIWPGIAYSHSVLSHDSKKAEFRNMYFDCLLLGVWSAMLGYYVWATLALGLGCLMNNLVVGGTRRLVVAAILFAGGAFAGGIVTGFDVRPYVGMGPDIYQGAGIAVYFLVLGYTLYGQNRKIGRSIREIQFKNQIFQSLLDLGVLAHRAPDISALLEESLRLLQTNFPSHGFAVYLHEHQRPEVTRYVTVVGIESKYEQDIIRLLARAQKQQESVFRLSEYPTGEQLYAASMAGRLSLYEGWLVVRVPRPNHALEATLLLLVDELAAATENKLLHLALQKAAERDGLTGLYNRGFFDSALQESIRSKIHRPEMDFAVLMIDVDGLKEVNDHLGHLAGDTLITRVADHLRAHCREGDILARYGGDEFVVLFPSAGISAANRMADLVRTHLEGERCVIANVNDSATEVTLRLSMGGASSADTPAHEVLAAADKRMYDNKIQRRENLKARA